MRRRPRRRRGARLAAFSVTLLTGVAAAGVAGPAVIAAAATPVRTGWWNTAPGGFFPAQTSSGQLAVSEGATGPMALAALAYAPGGAPTSGATLTLAVDGNSSFGPIQVQACPVSGSSLNWKAGSSQTGSPPAYDCARSAAGQLSASGTQVVFTLGSAQAEADGSFNLVVLPASGALPFQLVTDPPGPSSLAAKPAPPGAPAPAPASSPAGGGQPAPAPSGSGSGGTAPDTSGGGASPGSSGAPADQGVTLSPTDTSGAAALPAPTAPSPSSASTAPATAAPGSTTGGSNRVASGPALAPLPGTAASAGGSSSAGKILGFAAMLIVLVLYSEGFGVLGGRIRPLSSRFGRQPAGADRVSA